MIEKEKLDRILEAGRMAPTAKNQQPYKIYVLQSEEVLKKLSTLTHCVYGAKTVLFFTYDQEQDWKNLEKAFQIPENEKFVLIMPIGYKDDEAEPAPAHTASKESSELVCYL